MANYLKYKNYIGSVEFSAEDGVLFGKVAGINDLVSYEGTSVKELQQAFKEAVNDYLETCKDLGRNPDKLFKGVFNVRTSNERHRALSMLAEKKKMKLNDVVNKAFEYLVQNEDKVLH